MSKWRIYIDKDTASDEHWPSYWENRAGLPQVVGLCWTWTGTNIVGLFWFGYCLVGIEFRGGNEPSLGLVWNNGVYGFWRPEEEE